MMADRSMIHDWALVGGVIAGSSPPIFSVPPLMAQEIVMVVKIAELFGEKISKSEAKAVYEAAGCPVVGKSIFEATNVGYPATIPVRVTIAAGILEVAGNLVFDYYESKYGKEEGEGKIQASD